MVKHEKGFTIVELLIVIVVISILAALVIVAYTNVQAKASYSHMRSDMETLKKELEVYKVNTGTYPDSSACANVNYNYQSGWCGWDQGTGNSFIPGLVPTYVSATPNLDAGLPQRDSYLYQSRAADDTNPGAARYELIRFRGGELGGLSSVERTNNPDLLLGSGYDGLAWGFRSDSSSAWW